MEVWTFIHKETNEIIKSNCLVLDSEFGTKFYFSDYKHYQPWFSLNEEDLHFIKNTKYLYLEKSMFCNFPDKGNIDLEQYEIKKFIMD